ncbi:unnamed protein product [Heligmosomoides polygyrus]|uniref:Uncharacterized protein n=1 Tax=Heligmosomoides polygyrus TaxID=6339 RepID=A0A183FJ48_HELPZ|nr:unnamed protein product [Heligmosomoides polygyrus]
MSPEDKPSSAMARRPTSSELREKSQLADPLQHMKKSIYCWAGHCFDERTIDEVSVSQNGSRETIRDHWDDRNAMWRLILKIFQRSESASLDASSQRSSGLEELWSPLRRPPADKRTIKVSK